MVSLAFVRSPHAHAVIRWVDASAARRLEGVLAVLTAGDLRSVARPLAPRLDGDGFTPTAWPVLADGRTCFCGEAVAAVVATSGWVAADARELVRVEYEPLPASVSIDPAPAADRVLFRRRHRQGDVEGAFAGAPLVLRETFDHARCAPSPLEPRGVLADWDGETLTVWASTQTPSIMLTALAFSLGLPETRVRVIAPDVGGGFGLKTHVFPEDVAVAASARVLGRPVKWVEERRESLAAGSQARAQRMDVEVAAEADGVLRGLRARAVSDGGAYHVYPLTGDQAAARAAGRPVGVGIACYTEYTGMGSAVFRRRGMADVPGIEAATVTMGPDGTVSCLTSFPSQGQGHATTVAQLVADRLGVAMDAVRVLPADTLCAPRGRGTFRSRGPVINPLIVEGQIHGAVAQGIGEALLEAVVYGDDGQLLTATLMDYALPKADDVPPFEIVHLETPSPVMPGGVKGMGEGGTIGAPAAIANAVADAVRGLGVRVTRLPIRAESLVRAAVGGERPP